MDFLGSGREPKHAKEDKLNSYQRRRLQGIVCRWLSDQAEPNALEKIHEDITGKLKINQRAPPDPADLG
jgi:hypothetical protein